MARNGIAIKALGFLRKPLDKPGPISNFTLGLGQWFTPFRRQEHGQIILVLHDQLIPSLQDGSAILTGFTRPYLLRLHAGCNGAEDSVRNGQRGPKADDIAMHTVGQQDQPALHGLEFDRVGKIWVRGLAVFFAKFSRHRKAKATKIGDLRHPVSQRGKMLLQA